MPKWTGEVCGWSAKRPATAVFRVLEVTVLAVAVFGALAVPLLVVFLAAGGAWMTLAALGVGWAVQDHWPLARAQAWPSLAAP